MSYATEQPNVGEGIQYWEGQSADYNGVLGGFGNGSLPRVDALGSRQFLLRLMPELSTVPSAIRPLETKESSGRRTRAVDVGAGVGRVTSDALLHLVSDVVLVEPVEAFIGEALRRARTNTGAKRDDNLSRWKGIADNTKSVTFVRETLQAFDPCRPDPSKVIGRVGYTPPSDDLDSRFDVVWCQWCLGHLSDVDLVAFLRRGRQAFRDPESSVMVVKENLCSDAPDGGPRTVFDESDSSLTRSDMAWKKAFADAGLTLFHEQVQEGFPEGLYVVKMYALR